VAMWAADAKTRALSGRRDALQWHLQEIMGGFSTPVRVQAPMVTQVVLARPFLQTVCGRYLDTGSDTKRATRSWHAWHTSDSARLSVKRASPLRTTTGWHSSRPTQSRTPRASSG